MIRLKYTSLAFVIAVLAGCLSAPSIADRSLEGLLSAYPEGPIRSILVLPVDDYGLDPSLNIAEIYNGTLLRISRDRRFKLVDRSSLDRILKEQQLQESGLSSPENAAKIGNILGAALLLSTRIEQGILEQKIINVETSEVLAYTFVKLSDDKRYRPASSLPGKLEIRTGWLMPEAYQRYFDEKLKMGYFPVEVTGRNFNGWTQYSGLYRLNRADILWWTHHGMTEYTYRQKKQQHDAEGFRLVFESSFVDDSGTVRFNAIWYSK